MFRVLLFYTRIPSCFHFTWLPKLKYIYALYSLAIRCTIYNTIIFIRLLIWKGRRLFMPFVDNKYWKKYKKQTVHDYVRLRGKTRALSVSFTYEMAVWQPWIGAESSINCFIKSTNYHDNYLSQCLSVFSLQINIWYIHCCNEKNAFMTSSFFPLFN